MDQMKKLVSDSPVDNRVYNVYIMEKQDQKSLDRQSQHYNER